MSKQPWGCLKGIGEVFTLAEDVKDNVGYISSLGVPQIQAKREAAEVAQANADRAIRKRQIEVDEENLKEETVFSSNKERSNAEIGKERARAEQAEAFARAQEEQAVLKQEASNKEARLDAEVRRVAEAERYRREQEAQAAAYERIQEAQAERDIAERRAEARRLQAEAEAAAVRLEGEARAAAIRAEAEALEQNREALLAQKALELLPDIVERFARGYSSIEGLTIIGNGGEGGASAHLAGEQASALKASFATVKATTGIDLAQVLQASVTGQAMGRGLAAGKATAEELEEAPSREVPTPLSTDTTAASPTFFEEELPSSDAL